ncbi:MAG: UDP-2,3-diacylglucosamine diphosphatase [Candidatus Latescibacterota bacterium]
MDSPVSYRTIWLSDIHLGTRASKAEKLLDFIRQNDSDYLYLVGDIVDGWALRRHWHWPQLHNDVVQKLLRKARKGTRVVYVPGNHDEFARQFVGLRFGGIDIARERVHKTADGRRLLVLHGDRFDGIVGQARWLLHLGAVGYEIALQANRLVNFFRERRGKPYWSLSSYVKDKSKRAVQFIANFENAIAEEAGRYDVDGIVCGHIHKAEIRTINDVLYCNTGDWVESCTALVEHHDGRLESISWTDTKRIFRDPVAALSQGDGHIGSSVGISWVCHLRDEED